MSKEQHYTIPGSGLVLRLILFMNQAAWTDVNKTAWWENTSPRQGRWVTAEIGVTQLYVEGRDGLLVRRDFEAIRGATYDDGSAARQVGEDFLTRYRVSDIVPCEAETWKMEFNMKEGEKRVKI